MKRKWKRAVCIVSVMLLSILVVFSAGLPVWAEETDGDSEVLEATSYKVGDIIKFGHYEQDGNTANGKEEIEWEVLKVETDRVMVVSKYALDCKPYNDEYTDVTWETCTLRKWLNDEFKNDAFTSVEQEKIPTITVVNENNPCYGTSGGNNTQDQIFCLSIEEIKNLIGYNWYNNQYMYGFSQKMIVEPTQYAINNGAYVYTITMDDYYNDFGLKKHGYTSSVIGSRGALWWLRSPGIEKNNACYVDYLGGAGAYYVSDFVDLFSHDSFAIRPALYIKITVEPKSINLNKTSAIMYYGESAPLTATILPEDATDKTVTWTSSNPAVATVNNGVVKAKSAGKTTITAKTVNGLTATCNITVFADNVSGNIFADIKADSWMYAPAKSVYDKGYMTGTGTLDGRVLFSPNTDMNRTMFVQALYSMDGKPAVTYIQKFSDVKESAWYAKAVTWASNNGVVAGNPDGTFGINGKATREQLALMFYKYAVSKGFDVTVKPSTSLDGFTDANKVDSWALTAVKWAVERGIISGKGNASAGYRIAPTEKATRVECAAMMNKFSEIYANAPKLGDEDLEEPLALPEEEIVDLPIPADETEDVIIDDEKDETEDEDVPSEDETDTNEEEMFPEEELEIE